MPLIRPSAYVTVMAVTNDILANVVQLQNAGPGDYCITPLQNDPSTSAVLAPLATMTVNDGRANVLSGEPIPSTPSPRGVSGSDAILYTAPYFVAGQKQYFVRVVQGQRLIINIGGTVNPASNKVGIFIEKYA